MIQHRLQAGAAFACLVLAFSCNSGTSGSGGGSHSMSLDYVSNGFGQLLPHTTFVLDSFTGQPTPQIIELRDADQIINNVSLSNPVHEVPVFGEEAVLPNGIAGNQFLHALFTSEVAIDSVLTDLPAQQETGGLSGSIQVLWVDPVSGSMTPIPGRSFVGGMTYSGGPVGDPDPRMQLETWVSAGEFGLEVNPEVDNNGDGVPDGLGFPGVLSSFSGDSDLVRPESFVFIPDSDSDLTTFETFPADGQIMMIIERSVTGLNGLPLEDRAVACTTVGTDDIEPEVAILPPPLGSVDTIPANGADDVDPAMSVTVRFTESIQPTSVGDLPTYGAPNLSPAISIQFGPETRRVDVPFTVMPVSPYDLTTFVLEPAFHFPGEGPDDFGCGVFDVVDIKVNAGQFQDLAQVDVDGDGVNDRGNLNSLSGMSTFKTGEGPGLANVPVTPDAIYAGRAGATPGLSVIDLNGFGQSTGNPIYDDSFSTFSRGDSNFPNNPNVKLQGNLLKPALQTGSCTIDGGSSGVFSLTLDSNLTEVLARAPVITAVGDMMLGHALDSSFNNAPAPYGCQSGGGNLCAQDGLKQIAVIQGGPFSLTPPRVIPTNPTLNTVTGGENIVSWAPHPNPPALTFPPLCVWPFLGTEEPSSIDVTFPPDPTVPALNNWLAPGDPFGDPNGEGSGIPTPPSGLLAVEQNAWFDGPPLPQLTIAGCQQYKVRQQVGNFLYVLDRSRGEVVVLNSNRMTVIDRILVPDPTELAIGPNLDLLAISNQQVDLVTFLDIDPSSASFHTIVQQVVVGDRPRGIAWEPGNEDILVCNEGDNSLSIISAFSLEVRKVVDSNLAEPFALAITPRQQNFGFFRNVYFAYIMNRNGRVAIFESGPNEVNGWGYDDVVGTAPQTFQSPKAIQPDHTFLAGGVWIAHEGPINVQDQSAGSPGVAALSNMVVNSAIQGVLPLNVQSLLIPNFRDMSLEVRVSLGTDQLTGIPVDLAFDNLRNFGGLQNLASVFSAGVPAPLNGKSLVRNVGAVGPLPANNCNYMFVAIPNPNAASEGNVDVIDISGGYTRIDTNAHEPGIQSIRIDDVDVLMDYFRQ